VGGVFWIVAIIVIFSWKVGRSFVESGLEPDFWTEKPVANRWRVFPLIGESWRSLAYVCYASD
jgi:hypothetical protein